MIWIIECYFWKRQNNLKGTKTGQVRYPVAQGVYGSSYFCVLKSFCFQFKSDGRSPSKHILNIAMSLKGQ